ncbi:MAG: M20/M25/M40 family metallo-hydrolase, partial [Eggerthellaceae bacterium]|nr:M20/M25/M40 family metallo-hydrolase [Eggerthellaceae bacterium]
CADGGESFAVIRSAGDTILSADDKAGIAAIFEGVRATLEAASARPSITVVLTTCEEQSLLGASALDPAAFDPAMFNPPTTPTAEPAPEAVPCFVLDADGRPGSIVVGAPFHYTMRATFAGRAAHAGVEPEAGASAVQMAAHAIGNMPLGRIDERTTANVGVIAGGAAVNVVPGECRIEGECRSLYEDRVNAQRDAMTAACEAAAARFSGTVDVAWTVDYPGILHEPDAPVVQRLARAAEAAGLASRLTVSGGGADANVLGTKGACAVTLGIGMTNFHSVDEYIAVRDLEGAARYVEAIIAEYAR